MGNLGSEIQDSIHPLMDLLPQEAFPKAVSQEENQVQNVTKHQVGAGSGGSCCLVGKRNIYKNNYNLIVI